jgi:hypothetical protein
MVLFSWTGRIAQNNSKWCDWRTESWYKYHQGNRGKEISNDTVLVFFAVFSSRSEFAHRENLRQSSWISEIESYKEQFNITYRFIVGGTSSTEADVEETNAQLRAEQKRHNDMIILPNIDDQYQKLNEKMAALFVWSWKEAPFKFNYLFKGMSHRW